MLALVAVAVVTSAAAVIAAAAARYRLPVEFIPATALLAGVAATLPIWLGGPTGHAWAIALCAASALTMITAAARGLHTRGAQLSPGWSRRLERRVAAESGPGAHDY